MEALLLVAERNGKTMLTRIGMMRPINRLETKPTQAPRKRARRTGSCLRAGLQHAGCFLFSTAVINVPLLKALQSEATINGAFAQWQHLCA
jgi:hypothetical protein